MRQFISLTLLCSAAVIFGCNSSSNEITELRAELDATKAELTQLKESSDNGPSANLDVVLSSGFPKAFGSGTWEVGVDIEAGTYVSRRDTNVSFNNPFCSWERLSGLGGTISESITAGLTDGNAIVEIQPSDIGFTSIGYEEWTKREIQRFSNLLFIFQRFLSVSSN